MGLSLMLFAWRLTRGSSGWSGRLIVTGALLLTIGYAFVLPVFETGNLDPHTEAGRAARAAGTTQAWQVLRLVVMNAGWLFFGWGLALHAGLLDIFRSSTPTLRRHVRRV